MKIHHLALSFILLLPLRTQVAVGSTLYTLNVNGKGNILRVDPSTGTTTAINPSIGLGAGSWSGLAADFNDPGFLFGLNNPRPPMFEDPQTSRLARIDLSTGEAELLPLFDTQTLGFSQPFSTGLAVSPLNPDVAIVVGWDRPEPRVRILWKVNTQTGEVLGPAIPIEGQLRLESLTVGPDGETFYATNQLGELVTLNSDTGKVTAIGSPGLSDFLTGLVFRPEDNTLLAIDGESRDQLVQLDAATGKLLKVLGPLGIQGPEGLAVIPTPEPSTVVLLLLGSGFLTFWAYATGNVARGGIT